VPTQRIKRQKSAAGFEWKQQIRVVTPAPKKYLLGTNPKSNR
jgi:hypothetical protein